MSLQKGNTALLLNSPTFSDHGPHSTLQIEWPFRQASTTPSNGQAMTATDMIISE